MTFPDPQWYPGLGAALGDLNLQQPYSTRSLGGGDINQTSVIEDSRGTRVFLKQHPSADPDHFASEYDGLLALGQVVARLPGGLVSPRPLALGATGAGTGGTFLVLEYFEPGKGPRSGDWLALGRNLGDFYLASAGLSPPTFGYHRTNRLGTTIQINTPETDWGRFFAHHRLGYLRQVLVDQGKISSDLGYSLDELASRLPELLPSNPLKALIHGDLWRGNLMFDTQGRGVLIDPAVYWGTPEADLAMSELFGGFPQDFFRGVSQVTGESPDHRGREVYSLYHLLNHLLLFGSSYLRGVHASLTQLLGKT